MIRRLFFPLFVLSQALICSAIQAAPNILLDYTFDAEKNILGDWTVPPEVLTKLNDGFMLESEDEGVLLKTTNTNVRLTKGDEKWENFRVTLSGRIEYPCSFEVIGRYQDKPVPSYYFLRIDATTKQLILGRFRNLKTEVLQGVSLPSTFKSQDFELALEFDGQNIKGYLNGELLVDQADDGALPAGQVGIIGQYHTQLRLKAIEVTPPVFGGSSNIRSEASSKPVVQSAPIKPVTSTEKDPTLSLALKDWDLSRAFKKKMVSGTSIL